MFELSLRTKIVLLVTGSLLLSSAGYVLLGTHLIVQDKTSYIYDFASAQVSVFSESLTHILEPLDALGVELERTHLSVAANSVQSLASLLKLDLKEVQTDRSLAKPGAIDFSLHSKGKALEISFHLNDGRSVVAVQPQNPFRDENMAKDFSLCIYSPESKTVVYSIERQSLKTFTQCAEIGANLDTDFNKGARDMVLNGASFIVSYERILGGRLIVLSAISKDMAFQSADYLRNRSLLLGVSLFLLTVGISLILVGSMVRRINRLVKATHEIAAGNFEFMLGGSAGSKDEIELVSHSFNVMSGKIRNLLAETAENARMGKELETAQIVQRNFFPKAFYSDQAITIEGMNLSATECCGDFWQYRKVGSKVFFIFGDITGHGVSAALLTAQVHAVFSLFMEQYQKAEKIDAHVFLSSLSEMLNAVVFQASKNQASFPCVVYVIDETEKTVHFMNHGHPEPLVWREGSEKWQFLRSKLGTPLGEEIYEPGQIHSLEWTEGLKLLFYTDGIFEARPSDGLSWNKKRLLGSLNDFMKDQSNSESIVRSLMRSVSSFFESDLAHRPDDISLVQINFDATEASASLSAAIAAE